MLNALVIAGPTACGKSETAFAAAKAIGGEIVSVDAGAVYREMDIGAAKPPQKWREEVRHHLFDVCNPGERFDAGAFCRLAADAAREIHARGKTPIFAGGTMMYFYALRERMHDIPPVPAKTRDETEQELRARGVKAMHNELAQADPQSAQNIADNDSQRICRALAVLRATGKPLSEWKSGKRPPPFLRMRAALFIPEDRALLRKRIGERLKLMFAEGLAEETRAVINKWHLPPSTQCLTLAGYRQAAAHIRGEITEEVMHERAYHATCQLAKRQLSRLRAWQAPDIVIDPFAKNAQSRFLAFAKQT